MIRRDAIRQLIQEHGPEGYLQTQAALLEGRTLPNGRRERVRPEDFSFRALWEGLVGPVEETLSVVQDTMGYIERPLQEAVTTSAFPSAVGQLISAKVIAGYEGVGNMIGDELVTTMPSKLRGERMVGFTGLQGVKAVEEGEAYQGSGFREKYVTTQETKRGRLLEITEEAVFFDQTGQILLRAGQLGEVARQDKERRIVRGVADVSSTEPVYRPSGVAAQLYVDATNHNLLATATVLADWTDVQEAIAYHAANQRDDREPDDQNTTQPIVFAPTHLLTATKLAGVAALIINAIRIEQGVNIGPNVLQQLVPGLRSVSSPFLDAAEGANQFDDADDWFLGDFKRQFIYKEIWPIQVLRAPAGNEEEFTRDIVARFKVREFGDINAIDHRYVLKVNAV